LRSMSHIPANNYGIARIEIPAASTYGWQVRLQRRGEKSSRLFSDRSHGDAQSAFLAASQWRDLILSQWQQQERARICEASTRNVSGVVGVSRIVVRAASGIEYFFWQATWCPSANTRRSVRFSVKKHGDAHAYQLAISARRLAVE
jgi:AP2 domain